MTIPGQSHPHEDVYQQFRSEVQAAMTARVA